MLLDSILTTEGSDGDSRLHDHENEDAGSDTPQTNPTRDVQDDGKNDDNSRCTAAWYRCKFVGDNLTGTKTSNLET